MSTFRPGLSLALDFYRDIMQGFAGRRGAGTYRVTRRPADNGMHEERAVRYLTGQGCGYPSGA